MEPNTHISPTPISQVKPLRQISLLILLPEKYTAVITLTATLDSPLPSARISTAVPSYTSPNAPLPNNLCKLSLSRGKAGSDSISAWEGRVLQNSNTSHLFIPKDVWNSIKNQMKLVLFVSSGIFKGSSGEAWIFWKLLENTRCSFPAHLCFLPGWHERWAGGNPG